MFVRTWTRRPPIAPVLVLAFLFSGPATAFEQPKRAAPVNSAPPVKSESSSMHIDSASLTAGYVVKPADVALPAGVPIGQYRRYFQPFPNWTLICDENLSKKQKVCNIAQTIVGPDSSFVFSWSLAAGQDGKPIFILRVPLSIGERGVIRLTLPDGGRPVEVTVQGCTLVNCLAYQNLGARLRTAVEKGVTVDVSYIAGSQPQRLSFRAPLAGLATALAAI